METFLQRQTYSLLLTDQAQNDLHITVVHKACQMYIYMSVQPHIVWKYPSYFVLVLQGRVCWQAIKRRKVWEWYSIIMHWTFSTLFFYISSHFCVVMQKIAAQETTFSLPLSPQLFPTKITKPFTLVWNSGKVWRRQCIIQYNYEEPITLLIILYIIYWQRLFHFRFLKFD